MERTTSELVSHGAAPHMGLLRCMMERRGRRSLKGYKKRFWVVNERSCRLEVYRNDQEHVPLRVFRASDIRNVIYADDKQNRFFVMVVQNRGARDINFRMSSFEEREEWSNAITRIMDTYTTINKHRNVLGMIQRRANTVSDGLGVKISIDSARLLAEVPDSLLQYVAEAVDISLASVTAIVRAYSGESADMPRNYILYVHAITDEYAVAVRRGPKYNPVGRTMTLNVCLLKVKTDRVSFVVTQPDEVFRLVQSNVFRNPVIEGWIETEPNCARACADIQEYLGVPSTKKGWITFQWGQHVSDGAKVEAFLQRFVTAAFFEGALRSVREAVVRVERVIAEVNLQTLMRNSALGQLAAGQRDSSTVSARLQRRSNTTTTFNVGEGATAAGLGNASVVAAGASITGMPASFVHSRQTSTGVLAASASEESLAVKLIRDNIAGLCIQLEKRAVEEGRSPPTFSAVHTPDYEQHCRPAFLLVSKFRRCFPHQHPVTGDSLSDGLYEVAFNAFLQMQLSQLRTDLNGIFLRQVKVVVMWDHLFKTAAELPMSLTMQELPHLVRHVRGVCLSRLQHVAQVLRHSQAQLAGPTLQLEENSLYSIFCTCVSAVVVDFAAYAPTGRASEVRIFEPSVNASVLTDTLYCVREEDTQRLMHALGHNHRSGASTVRVGPAMSSFHGVNLYAAEAKLGGWCENYFSLPEHTTPAALAQQVEDEFDSDSDGDTVGTLQLADFGEAVAHERSAEIQLLTMQRVVNAIYDSQRRAPVDLKIGSDDILKAIRAFASAFGKDKRPSKHDVARVLIVNLQRLRQMYVRAVDDETTSLLTWAQARELLRDFCEYETDEQYIDDELRRVSIPEAAQESMRSSPQEQPSDSHEPFMSNSSASAHVTDAGLRLEATGEDGRLSALNAANTTTSNIRSNPSAVNSDLSVNNTFPHPAKSTHLPHRLNGAQHSTVARRRLSVTSMRHQPVQEPPNPEAAAAAATAASTPASAASSTAPAPLRITNPSAAPEAYDFACISEVALTKLLPREALLARLAWRVGLVFGLENTGKSLIINSMQGVARPTVATVGMSQRVVAFEEWVWALNELGGRESFRSNWRYYVLRMEQVHFLMFVVDVRNEQGFREAYLYLKEVTEHYRSVPLVVLFNNFREGHRRFDIKEFEALINLQKLRSRHEAEVLSCVCDITVVHSKNRRLPPALETTLRHLSSLLLSRSQQKLKDAELPAKPKAAPVSACGSAVGGGFAMSGLGRAGSSVSFALTPLQPRQGSTRAT
ncbi:hypothetical protein ABB37_03835 [Leptomonas pyrrhocoris]|uniref:PH domain-containing protein n=1 Tax=Leptomonas pyrrhocoris TaxID=157538 RepID=A0A0N1J4X9_LEPPY|nr:hypothetical protein ABB37_03835 [Leptomonas pyrrhocoris]KPA81478.1 hypothetical protein ABB37_03835 [Leptomonas pyrrhocoris]|eukprot:XP_015659917.1 hypothetical protein ABB37_03835 [Leptomonas pyrrhocoris]